MRILITNDDGIYAEGLALLVEKAKKYGEVFVIAPKEEQSAKSHSINIKSEIECKKIDLFEGVTSYCISSSPADCVRFAYYGLKLDYDIVFSGVNKGLNLGEDIMYSGTCAAIFETESTKKLGIAFSCEKDSFEGFIKYFDDVMDYFIKNNLFEYNLIYNVNFPKHSNGILITKQGGCNFDTFFESKDGVWYYQKGIPTFENSKEKLHLDTSAIMNGYISITPLTSDRTNLKIYESLRIKKEEK